VVDFQKGERYVWLLWGVISDDLMSPSHRQINMDYSICKALSYNMQDIPVALVMYNVMCQYQVHFHKRVKNSPELSLPGSLELRKSIRLFHICRHQDSCLP
jgi:hypothetical protein